MSVFGICSVNKDVNLYSLLFFDFIMFVKNGKKNIMKIIIIFIDVMFLKYFNL